MNESNEANPYQSPVSGIPQHGAAPAGNPLIIPGIILIVVACFSMLFVLVNSLVALSRIPQISNAASSSGEAAGYFFGYLIWFSTSFFYQLGYTVYDFWTSDTFFGGATAC